MKKRKSVIWTIIISEKDNTFVIKSKGVDKKDAYINYIMELFKNSKHKKILECECRKNDILYVKHLLLKNDKIIDIRCVEGHPKKYFPKLEDYRAHLNKPKRNRKILIGILCALIGLLSILYFAL